MTEAGADSVSARGRLRAARVEVAGAVQGVGFRPFVYRLARELALGGTVANGPQGVVIEVEGAEESVEAFVARLGAEAPPLSILRQVAVVRHEPRGLGAFAIVPSEASGMPATLALPDVATCAECLREVFDPADRRFRYPFANCTHCGPRFSILEGLPYDRLRTTMKAFAMCDDCLREYEDPGDRRFHAQPNACPRCGPQVELWNGVGAVVGRHDEAMRACAEAIRAGRIVAVKGLGGFHLVADARNDVAVALLRRRKGREEKPLAVMMPDLDAVRAVCRVTPLEEALLTSPECPIVLLARAVPDAVAPSVAPGNPYLGVMLPYTPLHHLLMDDLGFPVVATSGNLHDEPICTDERDALHRLAAVADLFLAHNRPIARHVDDSVVRVMAGREMVLRRARGYAPLPIPLEKDGPDVLATGAYLKNAVVLVRGREAFVSPHVGDLETPEAFDAFLRTAASLTGLYGARPERVAADPHPDYPSSRYARTLGVPVLDVQHHHAHVRSCMAENDLRETVLGIAWDGAGYGPDGTVWGGEFLCVDGDGFRRAAHLRPFRLPGGDAAAREPRRSAVGLLYEVYGDDLFAQDDLSPIACLPPAMRDVMRLMLRGRVNAPVTSSAGRLFDAVASIAGLRQECGFEGQAAMELEFALPETPCGEAYPYTFQADRQPMVLDWGPAVAPLLCDVRAGAPIGTVSARFHNMLVRMMVDVARHVDVRAVVLSGGCFQNRYLTERAVDRLRAAGFTPYWHRLVPPNDGGIALGQAAAARGG